MSQQGKRALLIVDEAQNLTPRAVEELRMLSNFQLETHALLQSFLVGQPEFRRTMQSPQMLQLRQRVIAACHIGPMDVDETRGYIEHRLKCVGWKGDPKFQPDAYEGIFKAIGRNSPPHQRGMRPDAAVGLPRRQAGIHARRRRDGRARDARRNGRRRSPAPDARSRRYAGRTRSRCAAPRRRPTDAARLQLDAKSVDEASRLLAKMQSDPIEERLTRLERRADTIVALLQQLLDAVRPQAAKKQVKP